MKKWVPVVLSSYGVLGSVFFAVFLCTLAIDPPAENVGKSYDVEDYPAFVNLVMFLGVGLGATVGICRRGRDEWPGLLDGFAVPVVYGRVSIAGIVVAMTVYAVAAQGASKILLLYPIFGLAVALYLMVVGLFGSDVMVLFPQLRDRNSVRRIKRAVRRRRFRGRRGE